MKRVWVVATGLVVVLALSACGSGGGGSSSGSSSNPSRVIHLVSTGQTTCYDSAGAVISCTTTTTGQGQDAAHIINPLSYTDNGDGTITDNVTGLLWQKCTGGLSGANCATGTAVTFNWYQASGTANATYNPLGATNVCGSLSLAGTGWRLPTDFELMTIVDYGPSNPAINATYFPATQIWDYWSSTTYAPISADVWAAFFSYGDVNKVSKSSTGYVRCVR